MRMRLLGYALFILLISIRFMLDAWLGTYTLKDFRGVSMKEIGEVFSEEDSLYEFINDLTEFCEYGMQDRGM